jgi:ADP-ribosylglycohydrolase
MDNASDFYKSDIINLMEWAQFARMYSMTEFAEISKDEIRSSGYVVDSLEAAVWSLITTDSFEDGLLRAVNLGDDADTVGAIAGGLAGLYYGYNSIPKEWRNALIKKDELLEICEAVGECI